MISIKIYSKSMIKKADKNINTQKENSRYKL